MAKMNNCLLCGNEYEVCKLCANVRKYTPWRVECDTPRHWQIYMFVKDVRAGILKDSEAKEWIEFNKLTVEEVKSFVPSVQETLLPLFKSSVAESENKQEDNQSGIKKMTKKSSIKQPEE